MPDSITVILIFGISTLISATFGFGSAIFAMPLLTLTVGLTTALPLFGLMAPTVSGLIILGSWRTIKWTATWRLILATFVGIPLGISIIQIVPSVIVTRLLGSLLIGFGGYRLSQWELPHINATQWALPVGFCAGILGGAYNTPGPPIVIYGNLCRWSPQEFRATLQGYFFPVTLMITVMQGMAGMWTPEIIGLYLLSIPSTLLAIALGAWLNRTLPVQSFQALLSGLVMLLGLMMWWRS